MIHYEDDPDVIMFMIILIRLIIANRTVMVMMISVRSFRLFCLGTMKMVIITMGRLCTRSPKIWIIKKTSSTIELMIIRLAIWDNEIDDDDRGHDAETIVEVVLFSCENHVTNISPRKEKLRRRCCI